jgi:hypothetical protein
MHIVVPLSSELDGLAITVPSKPTRLVLFVFQKKMDTTVAFHFAHCRRKFVKKVLWAFIDDGVNSV